jgi:ABC-type methionine transport system ATPase subunit
MADEPTAALSRETGVEMVGMFQRLNRDHLITVVLVTREVDGEGMSPGVPS